MNWYLSLNQSRFNASQRDCMFHLFVMQRLVEIAAQYDEPFAKKKNAEMEKIMAAYTAKGGSLGM